MSVRIMRSEDPTSSLQTYIADRVEGLPVPGTGLRRLIGTAIPKSWRPMIRRISTNIAAPHARMVAARLSRSESVKLHLGCGESPKPGWINIDLVGLPVDLAWNLDNGLPFADGTADAVFHEHVLEHLELDKGLALLRESYRVLKPGGLMRIGVPDAGRYVLSYSDPNKEFLHAMRPGRPTPMLALQEEFYSHGHRTMYDFETMEMVCRAAGFRKIEQKQIFETRIEPSPDSPHRAGDTLYVEAVR